MTAQRQASWVDLKISQLWFQKKSKRGIATPQQDLDRIVVRLKALRRERQEPAGAAQIAQLLARREMRQRLIEQNRRKQDEAK